MHHLAAEGAPFKEVALRALNKCTASGLRVLDGLPELSRQKLRFPWGGAARKDETEAMQAMEAHIVDWLARYGYGAGALAVLSDATGIPWAWVFVMLLAGQAGKSVIGMLLVGFSTLFAWDVVLYFVGWKWGTRLLEWLQTRKPKWRQTLETARCEVGKRGALAVIVGRYLPFIGRWVGMGAGMARVPPLRFALYSLLGCALSAFGFGIPAHLLGRQLIDNPLVKQWMLIACAFGILSGVLVLVWNAVRSRLKARKSVADGT